MVEDEPIDGIQHAFLFKEFSGNMERQLQISPIAVSRLFSEFYPPSKSNARIRSPLVFSHAN